MSDPWAWLRNPNDPATIAYLEAENAYSDEWFGQHIGLIDELFEQIKGRVQETDVSAPVQDGPWWYSSRTVEGSSYAVHCRGTSAATASAHVLLDENIEVAGHDYLSINVFDVSPSHDLLAYSTDTDGSEHYTLRFRDLTTGLNLPDEIPDTTWGGSAWSADSTSIMYVVPDEQERPFRVMRHVLGTHVAQKGSQVGPDRLRFDFSHTKPMSPEEIRRAETLANEIILQNTPVETRLMAIEDARETGAMALFGEKYGDEVRVVSMGEPDDPKRPNKPWSIELCGGTHVRRTGQMN